MPYWRPRNLDRHYHKHPAGDDRECWMDLLLKSTDVTKNEYEAESKAVVDGAWIQYRAEELNRDAWDAFNHRDDPPFHDLSRYFVDRRTILTILMQGLDEIRSCFHEHFNGRHKFGAGRSKTPMELTEDKFRYAEHLVYEKKAGQLRKISVEEIEEELPDLIRSKLKELKF